MFNPNITNNFNKDYSPLIISQDPNVTEEKKITELFKAITDKGEKRYYYDSANEKILDSKVGIEKKERRTIYQIKNGDYLLKGKQIGKGKDNIVYKDLNLSKNKYVVRAVQTENLRSEEFDIYQRIFSQHVVGCFDIYDKMKNGKTKRIKILEYFEKGEMRKCSEMESLNSKEFVKLFLASMKGFKALHDLKYIHCDTHTGNIFLKEEKGKFIPKVADFGGARRISDLQDSEKLEQLNREKWTRCPPFIPPEIALWKNKEISEKSDTWGIAISMLNEYPSSFESEFCKHLLDIVPDVTYQDVEYNDQYDEYMKIHKSEEPENHDSIDHLFWRMLAPEANDRPDDDEIITLLEKLLN